MQVVHPVWCGLDVHQASLTACLRRMSDDGQITTEVHEFGTMFRDLLALSDGLVEAACPIGAMESTGVYWRPVYHVLAETVEVVVGNPQEMRRRLVRVRHQVVFGTLAAIEQALATHGWQINTAFVERLNLSFRQQLALYQAYYNFCLPHASLRQPLPYPVPTHGTGSVKQ